MNRVRPLLILAPFLAYATLDYVLRVNNAIIASDLVAEFDFDAAELGFVTSSFFVAFALAQLPMGLVLDRYGPRRVVATLLAVAAVGALVYVSAASATGLAFGRFLIGVGMAASLTGGITAGRLWFPPERLAQITAAIVAVTAVGGMLATGPMAALLAVVPWRGLIVALAGCCLFVMLAVLAVVPHHRQPAVSALGLGAQLADYGAIFTSLSFWRFTPIAMAGVGVAIAYQTLWTPLWLRDVAGYSAEARAWTLFSIFAAIFAGNLGFGWLTARLGGRAGAWEALALAGFGLSIGLQALLAATRGDLAPGVLWIASALFFACPIAAVSIVSRAFTPDTAGRVASAVIAMVFVAVFLTQWLNGVVIGAYPGNAGGGYAVQGHLATLWGVIALQALTLAWCLLAGRLEARALHML